MLLLRCTGFAAQTNSFLRRVFGARTHSAGGTAILIDHFKIRRVQTVAHVISKLRPCFGAVGTKSHTPRQRRLFGGSAEVARALRSQRRNLRVSKVGALKCLRLLSGVFIAQCTLALGHRVARFALRRALRHRVKHV
jgi:hypothetical protein